MRHLIAVLVALTVGLGGAVFTVAPADASPSKKCHGVQETRRKPHKKPGPDRVVSRRVDLFTNICRKQTAGVHGIYWVRPTALAGQYDVAHLERHPTLWGFPAGNVTNAVFHLSIYNHDTGYHRNVALKVGWDGDGSGGGLKGLGHLPRCYMPWIDTNGRVPGGHRSHCQYGASLEIIQMGPIPNNHLAIGRGYIM